MLFGADSRCCASDYPAVVAAKGPDFSYDLCPRAKIFRRDAPNVLSLDLIKHFLRYNEFQVCCCCCCLLLVLLLLLLFEVNCCCCCCCCCRVCWFFFAAAL